MAKKSIRQLANEHNVNTNDLISALGAKSGGDLVDDSDPKLLKFLQQLHNRSPEINTGDCDSEYDAAYSGVEGQSGTMITDVALRLTETLDEVALDMRMDAEGFLERRVIHYMGISSQDLPQRESGNRFQSIVKAGYQSHPLENWANKSLS